MEEDEFSWQKVCKVPVPTKDCHEEMESTENNPDFLGLFWCFPGEEKSQES